MVRLRLNAQGVLVGCALDAAQYCEYSYLSSLLKAGYLILIAGGIENGKL